MKRNSSFMLLVLSASAAAFLLVHAHYAQSSSVPAFTVQYTERATNNVTGKSVYKTGTFAFRSEGSTSQVDINHSPTGEVNVTRKIALPLKGQRIVLADSAGVKTTFPWSAGTVPLLPTSADSTCGATVEQPVLGYGKFLGVRVVKLVRDTGDRRLETWHAPSLGCYVLWHHIDFRSDDGKVTDYSEWAATTVTLGEPSPEFFQVPQSYREVRPSEMESAVRAHFGKDCQECANTKWKAQDDLYHRLWASTTAAPK